MFVVFEINLGCNCEKNLGWNDSVIIICELLLTYSELVNLLQHSTCVGK
jgi:hypothetical protein